MDKGHFTTREMLLTASCHFIEQLHKRIHNHHWSRINALTLIVLQPGEMHRSTGPWLQCKHTLSEKQLMAESL